MISGSCATVTGEQILWAKQNWFSDIAIQTDQLPAAGSRESEEERIINEALAALVKGGTMIVHTAIGLEDKRIVEVKAKASSLGLSLEKVCE